MTAMTPEAKARLRAYCADFAVLRTSQDIASLMDELDSSLALCERLRAALRECRTRFMAIAGPNDIVLSQFDSQLKREWWQKEAINGVKGVEALLGDGVYYSSESAVPAQESTHGAYIDMLAEACQLALAHFDAAWPAPFGGINPNEPPFVSVIWEALAKAKGWPSNQRDAARAALAALEAKP